MRVKHFLGMLKKKSIYAKYLFTFTNFVSSDLPNLDAQVRCAYNQYITVQTDLKHPLMINQPCNQAE